MRALLSLIAKDLLIELRLKDAITSILFLSVILSVTATSGIEQAMLDPPTLIRIFPVILWLIFLFSATTSLGRTAEHDLENKAYEGLILTGVSLSKIYVAKFISNSIFIFLGQLCALVILPILCGIPIAKAFSGLLALTIAVTFAYSALATLLSGISSVSRMKGLLLPIILLPLLFPLFFCAIEISSAIVIDGNIAYDSFWLSLLIALDVVYFTLGLNLYPFVLKE